MNMLTTFEEKYRLYSIVSMIASIRDVHISHCVVMYVVDPPMKLLDWIPEEKLNWEQLSSSKSPVPINLLIANQDKIDWYELSKNPSAIEMLTANQDKISWLALEINPAAEDLLEANQDKRYSFAQQWTMLKWVFGNPFERPFRREEEETKSEQWLAEKRDRIKWRDLSKNSDDVSFLEENLDKINWNTLSENPAAFLGTELYPDGILMANQDKIDWEGLSLNPAACLGTELYPDGILAANQDKIDWEFLSKNPAACSGTEMFPNGILSANQDKIEWYWLSSNPAIFEVDVERVKAARDMA